MELNRVPPNDLEAEQAILGSMLLDKDAVTQALEKLNEDDFYREDNKKIYMAMKNLYSNSMPIDTITLKAELTSIGDLEAVGGLEYIVELTSKVFTTTNVGQYIKIVEEKSALRNILKTANDLISLGYDETQEVENLIETAEKKIFNVMQRRNQKGYSSIKNILVDSFMELEELTNRKKHITGVPSGFIDLDNRTTGFHGSELILIAARPAMGKSAFALNIAAHAALREKIPVAIFSLEMSKEQMVNRIWSSEAMVDLNKMRTGKLNEEDWLKLTNSSGEMADLDNIYIDDTAGISIMEIRAKARRLKLEKNIGLIVVDYLQLIQGSSKKSGTREQEIAEISRSLKVLAKELNIPVIALAQLSRAPEQRQTDHRPMLSDLRESGSIEQDADIVMFLYRDDYYNKESEKKNVAEVIIAKQRSGSVGTTELLWLGNYTKFVNIQY